MYDKLTFPWASSLVGFIAFGLAIIPFGLLRYGKALRLHSKVARENAQKEEIAMGRKSEGDLEKS